MCWHFKVTFNNDGSEVIVAHLNQDANDPRWEISLINLSDGETVWNLEAPMHWMSDLSLRPDGEMLAIAGRNKVALLNVSTEVVSKELEYTLTHSCPNRDHLAQLLEPVWSPRRDMHGRD